MHDQKIAGERLIRLPDVLALFPVSRSTWWAGVKAGKYPAPQKLSQRCVAWRESEVRALIATDKVPQ